MALFSTLERFKTIVSTNVSLQAAEPFDLGKALERLKAALADESGFQLLSTGVPEDTSPDIPRFVFVYHGSKLQLSKVSLVLTIEYRGNAQRDYSICDHLLRSRIDKVFSALIPHIGPSFSFVGMVTNILFSFFGTEKVNPAQEIASQFFKVDPGSRVLQDAELRVGYREGDKYFINLSCSNYETRERVIPAPGATTSRQKGFIVIRDFEGEIADHGLSIVVDVNTKLYPRLYKHLPAIDRAACNEVFDLSLDVIESRLDSFLTSGKL